MWSRTFGPHWMCICTYADPWVLQSLLGSDSFGWVDSQHLVDEIFSLRSHRVPLWGGKLKSIHTHTCPHNMSNIFSGIKWEKWRVGDNKQQRQAHIVRSSFDLLVEFVLVLVPERRVSNQKDVEDHTYTQKHSFCLSEEKASEEAAVRNAHIKSLPHAQMSTGLPYASFLSTSGDK